MAKIVVLGAGVSGHTAISYLRKELGKEHEIDPLVQIFKFFWLNYKILNVVAMGHGGTRKKD